jgi:N-acetylglucosamine transport system substrate-binding protein
MKKFSRRDFLKASVMASGAVGLAACGVKATEVPTAVPQAAVELDLPFEVAPEAVNPFNLEPTTVEGVFFAGGYGDDYIKYAAKLQEKLHPGTTVTVQSIQKIMEQLQPRFVAGSPPDVIDNSGANMIKMADLVRDEQLADLAELMEAPALDTPGKKVKDTLFPGSQNSAIFDGVQYGLNMSYTISGIWYSKPAFEKAGYTYPKTWAEMLTLCEEIKKTGVAPWTYQGKYPYYIWGIVMNSMIYYSGGTEALVKLDNLEPNAWNNPDVVRAVEDLYQLWDKGYILEGTSGLTHTESQTEWLNGKATFIPCGNWLENEMKTLTPADFNMVVANTPGYADGKGKLNDVNAGGGETFIVPSKAKNVKQGMEYLRCLISKDSAKYFAENVRAIMPVFGGTEGANLSEAVKSAVSLAEGGDPFVMNLPNWYSSVSTELEVKTGELMTGTIKPAEFIAAMQKASDAVASDPDITKFKR